MLDITQAALEHYQASVDRMKKEREEIFNAMYDLLSVAVRQVDDTLWYDDTTTIHEALCDLAAQYDPVLGDKLALRLEADC